MATLAERRAELAAALADAGVRVADAGGREAVPYALIYGAGIAAQYRGNQVEASFRVVLVAGKADAAAMSAELGNAQLVALGAVRELAGWRLEATGPDTIRAIAGLEYLTADLVCSAHIIPAPPA